MAMKHKGRRKNMSATDPLYSKLNISARLEGLIESAGTTAELTKQYEENAKFRDLIHMEISRSMNHGGKDAYLEAIEEFEMQYLGE